MSKRVHMSVYKSVYAKAIVWTIVVIIAASIGAYAGYMSVEPIIIDRPCEINIKNIA